MGAWMWCGARAALEPRRNNGASDLTRRSSEAAPEPPCCRRAHAVITPPRMVRCSSSGVEVHYQREPEDNRDLS
ncbi:hypothetical protein ZWY2020_045357 [Hordeum vulgare]|nr:hypothetical protein ZWY2020_045357 [Hordeum vulgare]